MRDRDRKARLRRQSPPVPPPPRTAGARTRKLWLLLAAIAAGVIAGLWFLSSPPASPPTDETAPAPGSLADLPLPPLSESRHLNLGPDAQYVGIEACAECHRANYKSFRLTAHSRALAEVDPAAEPPDGSFDHASSGRSYRVYRKGSQLWHEELLRTETGAEVARVDRPVRYVVGSGRFSRSYLVEDDGFLFESPVTWYSSRKKWDMSPGYEGPAHAGFSRAIDQSCLICHAGRVDDAATSARAVIHEMAIGCESCHGPGSLHAERYRAGQPDPAGGEDLTIVNPGKLPRDRLEAVCANCHLSEAAAASPRGRDVGDFRPGTALTDYRIDYRLDAGDGRMTVVGHVGQLRQSRCYQKSDDLTCVTCHDPHAKETPADPVAFYRQKCLACHESHPCSLKPAQRLRKSPADDCTACHMPRGDTDIPHLAFTHHRIGRHSAAPATPPGPKRVPELVPTDDASRLPEVERRRALGLAYVRLSHSGKYPEFADAFRERGREILEPLYAAGLRDPLVGQSLAFIYWTMHDYARAGACAQQVLDAHDASPHVRADALAYRADSLVRQGQVNAAVGLLEEATRLRRSLDDWRMLGRLYLEQNQPAKALDALQQATSIRPDRYAVHAGLAEAYRRLGRDSLAREHEDKARWLFSHRRD
jgi:Tetratricopeptide repeat/Cytochrome c554 and c-prime